MKKVAMSDDAYIEFKEFLKSNDIDSDVIRINFEEIRRERIN